jgi:hypothetical protein
MLAPIDRDLDTALPAAAPSRGAAGAGTGSDLNFFADRHKGAGKRMVKRTLLISYLLLAVIPVLATLLLRDGDIDAVKTLLKPVARVFLDTFNNPTTAVLLALSIFAFGILVQLRFLLFRVRPTLRLARQLVYRINLLPSELPASGKHARLDAWLRDKPLLYPVWIQYSNTLLRHADTKHDLRSTAPPADFFNCGTLGEVTRDFRFFQALPGYFIGLGLILTFLGLVAGLYFASKGIAAAAATDARQALIQLLNASTFKFLTSIAGIATSLVLSLTAVYAMQGLQHRIQEIATALEEVFPVITTETLIYERLGNTALSFELLSEIADRLGSIEKSLALRPTPNRSTV